MQLDWLADVHRDAGLTVIEHTGWKTRSMRLFDDYTPVGLLNHHTAGSAVLTDYPNPPYYSNSSLEEKCNLTIRGDGVVVVLNAGWAFDSGWGDRFVLAAVKADQPAPAPSDTYVKNSKGEMVPGGSNPGVGMNRWYIDNEVQHLGNGDPIAPAQREVLIISNAVICRQMGWDSRFRLIGHRESTTRKIDPRWDGSSNPMPGIRVDTLEADMVDRNTKLGASSVLAGVFDKAVAAGVFSEHTQPDTIVTPDQLAAFLDRAGALQPGDARTWTTKQIAAMIAAAGVAGASVDQVIAEIIRRLG